MLWHLAWVSFIDSLIAKNNTKQEYNDYNLNVVLFTQMRRYNRHVPKTQTPFLPQTKDPLTFIIINLIRQLRI